MNDTVMPNPPATRDEIASALDRIREHGASYWSSFETAEFFAKIGDHWSPSDNVRHLTKAIRPVTKALRMPRLMLLWMFGRPRRPSVTYDQLRTRYQAALAEGGQAGRFAPSARTEPDPVSWRASILAQLDEACRELRAAVLRWPDARLDRYQLPHPLLGKLTVREMLLFTAYHQLHHLEGVERRRKG